MRLYEYKQSDTSPLKYNIQLSAEEMEKLKDREQRSEILKEILSRLSDIETRK